jgi:hypothetical protein
MASGISVGVVSKTDSLSFLFEPPSVGKARCGCRIRFVSRLAAFANYATEE